MHVGDPYILTFSRSHDPTGGGGVYLGFSRKGVRSKANPALITALPMNRHYSLRSGSFTILNFALVAPPFILRMRNLSHFDDVIHIE